MHRSWSIHTRMVGGTVAGSVYIGSSVTERSCRPAPLHLRQPRRAAPQRPTHLAPTERRRRRSVGVDARPRRSRTAVLPRPTRTRTPTAWFGDHDVDDRDAVRGDPLAGAGDRHVGAGSIRPVVVRVVDRRRVRATRSTTAVRPDRRRHRADAARRERRGRSATSTSTSARSTCPTTTRWRHGRSTPRATSGTRCTSATSPPVSICPTRSRTSPMPVSRGRATVSWLFYVTADDQERPYRVWRHACRRHRTARRPTTCSCTRRPTSATSSASAKPDPTTSSSSSRRARRAARSDSSPPTTRRRTPIARAPPARRHRVQRRPLG